MTFWVTLGAKGRFATTRSSAIFSFLFSFFSISVSCRRSFPSFRHCALIRSETHIEFGWSHCVLVLIFFVLVPHGPYAFHRNKFKRRTSKWALRRLIAAVDMKRIEWIVTRREEGTKQGKKGIPCSCLLIFHICEVSFF